MPREAFRRRTSLIDCGTCVGLSQSISDAPPTPPVSVVYDTSRRAAKQPVEHPNSVRTDDNHVCVLGFSGVANRFQGVPSTTRTTLRRRSLGTVAAANLQGLAGPVA